MSNHDILILYASQTGTAKYVAEDLERQLILREFKTLVQSMDDYAITNLPEEKYVIFVVSTTGQGEPPSNMINFWQFLLIKDLPNDALEDVNFTVFGLGDSNYQQFNSMARKLYQRMLQLGAKIFHERGLGDDQHPFGYDGELDSWTEKLFESLKNIFPNKQYENLEEKIKQLPQPRYQIELIKEQLLNEQTQQKLLENFKLIPTPQGCQKSQLIVSRVVDNELLTPADYDRETRKIEFEFDQNYQASYNPGDIIVIHPENSHQLCKDLADHLNLSLSQVIRITKNEKSLQQFKNPFPEYITIEQLFKQWLSISTPPTRYLFKLMSYFTNDELHKEKLIEISSKEGKEEYYNYVVKEKRNVFEILFDFGTVQIPLEYLIEGLSLQKPREYSISSSQLSNPSRVSITIGLVKYQTPFKRSIVGVCSQYLKDIELKQQKVIAWIKKGTMDMPFNDPTAPVILVGPGTGIAPFMSLVEQRNIQIERQQLTQELYQNKTFILFGCRYRSKEFYYQKFLEELHELNRINLFTAFSRDFDSKVYVQHLLTKHYEVFGDLIANNFEKIKIFVCGTAKYMPKQVEEGFIELLTKYLEGDSEKAKTIIQNLIKKRQYVVEAW
ncbi:hypothetical protein ABPG74_004118 [Tetrahymena malaccensis]